MDMDADGRWGGWVMMEHVRVEGGRIAGIEAPRLDCGRRLPHPKWLWPVGVS